MVSAAAKNLEKSLRKRVCSFANHGTLPLHGELSGQEADRISQKNQKSVFRSVLRPTRKELALQEENTRGVVTWKCPKREERRVMNLLSLYVRAWSDNEGAVKRHTLCPCQAHKKVDKRNQP